MKKGMVLFFLLLAGMPLQADEGMWIPLLLDKTRYEAMQNQGMFLSPQDIYDINHASLKDAVVLFDGGCTGVMVSAEGLLLTNHHCGFDQIQYHSSVENDYLTEGFWAGSREEELPNPGLAVDFLVSMQDVTEEVLSLVQDTLFDYTRELSLQKSLSVVASKYLPRGKGYRTDVKPLYHGNRYYVYVYRTYRDVRLVGAPPSSIGKFGGDTDNWMWPRHTGDFSVFRVYADKNNEPAEYSPENQPFCPDYFVPISLKGLDPGDFTMVLGYPGSTDRFITSPELSLLVNEEYPLRIALRSSKLDIWKQAMDGNPERRIQYAAKYASVSNAWKKWQGVIRGIERSGGIDRKKVFEEAFVESIGISLPENDYGGLLDSFAAYCDQQSRYLKPFLFFQEGWLGVEWFQHAGRVERMLHVLNAAPSDKRKALVDSFMNRHEGFYKNYDPDLDREVLLSVLKEYIHGVDPQFFPPGFSKLYRKHKDQGAGYLSRLHNRSVVNDSLRLRALLMETHPGNITRRFSLPEIVFYRDFEQSFHSDIFPFFDDCRTKLDSLSRVYARALLRIYGEHALYPDANLTLRVAYGRIEGYSPSDAVFYQPFTFLEGVMEKGNAGLPDYQVHEQLKRLYDARDFGPYATREGLLPVCMIGSNHTSGGNSGSPVFNRHGELMGLNFDRNWEGTMSDVLYDPGQCRNIMTDIRYVLFIIDKFAGAEHLLQEMVLKN